MVSKVSPIVFIYYKTGGLRIDFKTCISLEGLLISLTIFDGTNNFRDRRHKELGTSGPVNKKV
jgi:hypothetical protein